MIYWINNEDNKERTFDHKRLIKIILIILVLVISVVYNGYLLLYNSVNTYPNGRDTEYIEYAKEIDVFVDEYIPNSYYIIIPKSQDTSYITSVWLQNRYNANKNLFYKNKIKKTDFYLLKIDFQSEKFPRLILEDKFSHKKSGCADYALRQASFTFNYIPDSLDIDIYNQEDSSFIQNLKLYRKNMQ